MSNLPSNGFTKTICIALFILVLSFPLYGASSRNNHRPDLISIRLSGSADKKQMPDARFLHDKHTKALEDQDCNKCHQKEKNTFIFKFNRIKNSDYNTDKKLYHEKCIGCHQDRHSLGKICGPVASECRLCHLQTPDYISAITPFGFNKSLHYRHEMAETIRPAGAGKETNCSACHHQFDKDLDKTIYIKGEEGTCRYCHKVEKTGKARSFQTVAHIDCLNCHYKINSDNKKAGPINCAGCHDADKQSNIEILKDIPRIKRNQPDSVLLSLWVKNALKSGKPANQFVKPVAFNHKTHETKLEHCYTCHHESMESCTTCHSRMGSEKSQFIRLGKAMHATDSLNSCMGCHKQNLNDENCAGCHWQMADKHFAENNCNKCHTIDRKLLNPIPETKDKAVKIAKKEINSWPYPHSLIPQEEIPDTVTIDIMKDQYEGAILPHRKIVNALLKRVQKSDLARHFHDGTITLCSGCHHNSPSSVTPPKCASCHGISHASEPDGRPGLKGAYHSQCINCHQQMNIKKPVSTDCIACHKKIKAINNADAAIRR